MKLRLLKLISFVWIVSLAACSDDDGEYIPSYITDLVTVTTDAQGIVTSVQLDNGTTYSIASQGIKSDAPETDIRCRGTYVLKHGSMKMYSLTAIFANQAIPASSVRYVKNGTTYYGTENLPRDPVKLISMWKSGGYINLHVGVLTTGKGSHQYAFCQEGSGQYSLLHLRPDNDDESYTAHVFLSMPIPEGEDKLTFSVYTYDGVYTREF